VAAVDKEINKGKSCRPLFILPFFRAPHCGWRIYFGMIKNSSTNIIPGSSKREKGESG
jgi:hypothetical protein